MNSTPNPAPPPKSVGLLIGATLLLVGVNLAILIVVILPPKRRSIEGVVIFEGKVPTVQETSNISQTIPCKGGEHYSWGSGALFLSTNTARRELKEARRPAAQASSFFGLGEVLVRIVGPLPPSLQFVDSTQPGRPLVSVLECGFRPRWTIIRTNELLMLVNSNSAPQTITVLSKGSNAIVTWTATTVGQSKTVRFASEELFARVQVKGHPAIYGLIGVLDHPYFAMTDQDGVFRLPGGLPEGEFTLEAIHPTLGRRQIQVRPRQPSGPLVFRFGSE